MGRYNISLTCSLHVFLPTQSSKGIPHVVTSRVFVNPKIISAQGVFATKASVKSFIFPKHVYFGEFTTLCTNDNKNHYNTVFESKVTVI